MNSSFSSISFDAEIAKRFKEYSTKAALTHTQLLKYALDTLDNLNPTACPICKQNHTQNEHRFHLRTDKK